MGRWTVVAFVVLTVASPAARGAEWPTYRGDSQRSGVSRENLAFPLAKLWVHEPAATPQPAWPELPAKQDVWHRLSWLSPTVAFDRAFHVAVAGGRVYYGSSGDNTVYCLDAATGKTHWAFSTEGPVRLAPTIAQGRVYAGSDDGCLYCLNAADGALLWRHRAGPEDRRLPGNGRMISLWPVRCGEVVDGDALYFDAGLFPWIEPWISNSAGCKPSGEYTDLTNVVRSGCWINILPAGGLIMVPEFTAGCICGYSIQTSIALLPQSSGG